MLDNAKIKNTDELEFAVFCIANIAIRLRKNAEDIFYNSPGSDGD